MHRHEPYRGRLTALALLLLLSATLVASCARTPAPGHDATARQAEAQRLRQGLPEPLALDIAGQPVAAPSAAAVAPQFQTSAIAEADDADLVLGEFRLDRDKPVIDGDTVRVEGLDSTLRLLGFDTEESLKNEEHKRAAAADFAAYAVAQRGDSRFPVKYGTPMGEAATQWAKDFFAGHSTVRLEYDELGRKKGYFDRYLVYIFVKKNGEWVNYNVEAVRAGMAPYFPKYGYSRRFHDAFVSAQDEARAAGRGIWDARTGHYPDYDERLAWWNRRAETIATFEREHGNDPSYFQLGVDAEWERMAGAVGQTVTVFGTVGKMRLDDSPFIAFLSHKRNEDFTIVAFERPVLEALDLERHEGDYIYVRGVLSTYKGRYQFKADAVEKVWTE